MFEATTTFFKSLHALKHDFTWKFIKYKNIPKKILCSFYATYKSLLLVYAH